MASIIAEWAGAEREFRLTFGDVLDLEEAIGGDAIGALFLRVTSGKWRAQDVYQTIRLALISGGLSKLEAKRLLDERFDSHHYAENAALAGEILMAIMVGVEESGSSGGDHAPERIRFSEVSQICRTFHMSPGDLRSMAYADFINMVRGFNASSDTKAEPPSEEEFEAILEKYEPDAYERMMEQKV